MMSDYEGCDDLIKRQIVTCGEMKGRAMLHKVDQRTMGELETMFCNLVVFSNNALEPSVNGEYSNAAYVLLQEYSLQQQLQGSSLTLLEEFVIALTLSQGQGSFTIAARTLKRTLLLLRHLVFLAAFNQLRQSATEPGSSSAVHVLLRNGVSGSGLTAYLKLLQMLKVADRFDSNSLGKKQKSRVMVAVDGNSVFVDGHRFSR